ncbi:MAG TPA: hypothetical protein VGG77_12685 [Roseiarcus sp.]|jgi:hypothetical protein
MKAAVAKASGRKLGDATASVIRSKGRSTARVEDLRAEKSLTGGAFIRHFACKKAYPITATGRAAP